MEKSRDETNIMMEDDTSSKHSGTGRMEKMKKRAVKKKRVVVGSVVDKRDKFRAFRRDRRKVKVRMKKTFSETEKGAVITFPVANSVSDLLDTLTDDLSLAKNA